jgi:hypothetical protein
MALVNAKNVCRIPYTADKYNWEHNVCICISNSVEVASRLVSVLLDLADGVYEPFILSQVCIHGTQLHF